MRAPPLTSSVMTNSTRPEAISASRPITVASLNLLAMFWAKVPPPGSSRLALMSKVGERTMATAIVSPSARPRPSIEAEMMPERPKGITDIRMTSQRVAPRARAASSCMRGTCRKTSRLTLVMIGRIMIASRMPTVSSERGAPPLHSKIPVQPRYSSSQPKSPSMCGTRKSAPHRP